MAEVIRDNKMRLAVVQFIMTKFHLNPLLKHNGSLRMIRETCTQDTYYAAMCKCLKQLKFKTMTQLRAAIDEYGVGEKCLTRSFLQASLNKYLKGFKLTPTKVQTMAESFKLPKHTLKHQEEVFYKCFLKLKDLPYDDEFLTTTPIQFILSHGFKPTKLHNTTVYCNYSQGQILQFNTELGYIAQIYLKKYIHTDSQGLCASRFIRDGEKFILFTHTFHKNSTLKLWKPDNTNWCRLYFPSGNFIRVNYTSSKVFTDEIAIF